MNRVELIMRRRNVLAFIQADPVAIALVRGGTTQRTTAGGVIRGQGVTLPPQRARIVQAKRRYDNGLINSEAGHIPDTGYLLIGMHTFNVEVDDTFTWLGDHYHISGIHPTRTESKLCSIDFLGPTNG